MGTEELHLEGVLKRLRECRGVIAVRVLSDDEKRETLEVESKVEEKIILGMCKSLNKGVREALQREFTVAMVIETSQFQYPHHPYMIVTSGGVIVGELISDTSKIGELRKDPTNLFLWKNFAIYVKKLPKNPTERNEMRLIYQPGKPVQLQELSYVENGVFGTPSPEGDSLIKRMLAIRSEESVVGTCLIGFNIKT